MGASWRRVEEVLGEEMERGEVSVGAINGPEQVVLSGGVKEVEEAGRKLRRGAIASREMRVRQGYHSRQMNKASRRFEEEIAGERFEEGRIKYISCVSGRWAGEEVREAGYWGRQMRRG